MLYCLTHRFLSNEIERGRNMPSPEGELPPFSVIVISRDQCNELRQNLPLILNQIYPAFEVLVVDINSTDGTKKLLEKMEEEYPNLHHTFTPASARDISMQRLAITLGVKASIHPWIVITQADCTPVSHQWLKRMGESIKGHRSAEIVVGYTRYSKESDYTARKMFFYRFWQQMKTLAYAKKYGAYRSEGTNLAYKKELFLSHQGFASHVNLLMGATDIMVNQNSTKNNTALCIHPDSIIEQKVPARKHWVQDRLYFLESVKHFTRKKLYLTYDIATTCLHLLLALLMTATIVLSIMEGEYVITGVAAALWLAHFLTQGFIVNGTMKALNNTTLNIFSIAWFAHLIPVWNTKIFLQHALGSKQKFRKKYI